MTHMRPLAGDAVLRGSEWNLLFLRAGACGRAAAEVQRRQLPGPSPQRPPPPGAGAVPLVARPLALADLALAADLHGGVLPLVVDVEQIAVALHRQVDVRGHAV